jgi:signal transduction histidine kinase
MQPRGVGRIGDLADGLLAAAFVGITQLEIWVFEADAGHSLTVRLTAALMTLVASGALAFRRTHPAWAFWVNSAGVVGAIAVGFPSDFYQWTNLIAGYSVAAHGTSRQAWLALPSAIGGVLFYFARFPSEGGRVVAAFATTMWVVGWLAGRVYGARIAEIRLKSERDLSRRVAETQEARLELEVERARMARELHDIV